eukprot:2228034-Amphidinium_carterae.1
MSLKWFKSLGSQAVPHARRGVFANFKLWGGASPAHLEPLDFSLVLKSPYEIGRTLSQHENKRFATYHQKEC